MTVCAHAERLLLGDRLEDKLAPFPRPLRDAPGGPALAPDEPGRPAELRFGDAERRVRLPGAGALRNAARAAELLHAFANHELLAIELMALALLRFPQMDPRTRRELVATIEDEQRHLQGYLSRLEGMGTRFGAHPVSRFFWDALRGVPGPAAWHAGMALTLEQANLDFMTFYGAAFEQAGDPETAALLEGVRRDEIAHVARGLRALALPEEGLYDRWAALLTPPLSPRRARGPGFDRAGRLQAGLPAGYVDRVDLTGGSRGRPPDVWWFDVTAESDRGGGLLRQGPRGELARDLHLLPMVLAADDDVVLVLETPSPAWLRSLRAAGLPTVRHEVVDPSQAPRLEGPGRPALGELRPWGPGHSTERLLTPLLPRCAAAREHALAPDEPLGRKSQSAELLRRLLPELREAFGPGLLPDDAVPEVVSDLECLDAAIAGFRANGYEAFVVKADVSSSGRERIRLGRPGEPDEAQRGWLERRFSRGPLRVEPWLDGLADLSLHLTPTGRATWIACESDSAGRFRAAALGRVTSSLTPELARFLNRDGTDGARLRRLGAALGADPLIGGSKRPPAAFPRPLGVDALLFRGKDGEPRLHPLLEVNPRWTMGRVALRLGRQVSGRSVAAWVHQPLRGAAAADVVARVERLLPLEREPGARGAIRRGVVPTNDPAHARQLLTLLLVAGSPEELAAARAVL